MISKDIYESLGDKAYSELQKKSKDHKSKIKTIWDNRPWPLRGSYSNQQLLDLGFKRFEGGWKVPQSKFDELSEMTLRPLPTGKAEIPKVGEKKITEIDVYDRHKQVDGEPEEYTDSNEVEKQVMKSMHKDEIKKMMAGLTKIEKIVIIARFGLDNGKDYDLMQVGDMIGKSRERVRQIEAKALRKMRNKAMMHPYTTWRNLNPEHIEEGDLIPVDFPQYGEKEQVETPKGNIYTWSEVERGYSLFGRFTYEGGEFTMYYDPQMGQFDNREPIEGDPKAQLVIDSLPDEYFANDEKESVISGIIDMILEYADPQTEELNDLRRRAGIEGEMTEESAPVEFDNDSNEAHVAKMLAKALGDENRWSEMSAVELYAELESQDPDVADMLHKVAMTIYDIKLKERVYKNQGTSDAVTDTRGKDFQFDKLSKKFKSLDGEEAAVNTKLGKDLLRRRRNQMKRTNPSYPKNKA